MFLNKFNLKMSNELNDKYLTKLTLYRIKTFTHK